MKFLIQNDYQAFKNELQKIPHTQKHFLENNEIDMSHQTYFIITGRVIELLLLTDGDEHALIAYGNQTIFPPLFSESMTTVDTLTFRAIQPSTLWCYDSQLLAKYANSNDQFNFQLKQSYLKHMDYYLNDISQLIASSGMQRLVTFLLYYLDEHHPVDNIIPVRQKNIATLIAMNPTNMSRNIKKLKDANLVRISGDGITVLNYSELKRCLK